MNIPQIPTDNLYKFLAISAIVVPLIAVFLLASKAIDLDTNNRQLAGEIARLNLEAQSLSQQRHQLKTAIEELYQIAKLTEPLIVTDSLIIYTSIIVGPKNMVDKSAQIKQMVSLFNQKTLEYQTREIDIDTKRDLQKYNESIYWNLVYASSILLFFCGIVVTLGFSLWYNKVQKLQDAILLNQYLDISPDRLCQSCGILFSDDPQHGGTEKRRNKSLYYCSHCYSKGEFVEPQLTLAQMKKRVWNRSRELKIPYLVSIWHVNRISQFRRWQKHFNWK